jgi:hypothetical protein
VPHSNRVVQRMQAITPGFSMSAPASSRTVTISAGPKTAAMLRG